MICLSAKPVVDGVENELTGEARVVRVNVQDTVGGQLARQYEVYLVPVFIVLDATGREVWRQTGFPDRDRVLAEVRGLTRGYPSLP